MSTAPTPRPPAPLPSSSHHPLHPHKLLSSPRLSDVPRFGLEMFRQIAPPLVVSGTTTGRGGGGRRGRGGCCQTSTIVTLRQETVFENDVCFPFFLSSFYSPPPYPPLFSPRTPLPQPHLFFLRPQISGINSHFFSNSWLAGFEIDGAHDGYYYYYYYY